MIREVAQFLLRRAWARTLHGERDVRPWRWAKRWPVAKIEFPSHDSGCFVLAGANGGWVLDMQLAVLRLVNIGDEILLHTRDGHTTRYRVQQCRSVDGMGRFIVATRATRNH